MFVVYVMALKYDNNVIISAHIFTKLLILLQLFKPQLFKNT
jgi:hypothetical protein